MILPPFLRPFPDEQTPFNVLVGKSEPETIDFPCESEAGYSQFPVQPIHWPMGTQFLSEEFG